MTILDDARTVVYDDREGTYGEPGKNLARIAALWSAYLNRDMTPDDVCLMMILLKIARLLNDPEHKDSQVDICGYAALMERIQQ